MTCGKVIVHENFCTVNHVFVFVYIFMCLCCDMGHCQNV